MTPAEQIAYLRRIHNTDWSNLTTKTIRAVCDLAERALEDGGRPLCPHGCRYTIHAHGCRPLTDDEAEAVRRRLARDYTTEDEAVVLAVLRRLLPDERVEHRLVFVDARSVDLVCTCGMFFGPMYRNDVLSMAAAHAGIGGTE